MRNDSVLPYYNALKRHRWAIFFKRIFDIVVSLALLVVLSPLIVIVGVLIRLDSEGPVFFKQIRVTQYGQMFKIIKFRTMVVNADKFGSLLTLENDPRITKIGSKLRKYRIDEIPQLINILKGEMSFVGTRPQVVKYVDKYTDEMKATLLLPAGVTSEASIKYKDEDKIIANADDVDTVYEKIILPGKMKLNLESIKNFSFLRELGTMVRTVLVVAGGKKESVKREKRGKGVNM
ncbi:sugar transferase [Clostridium sp. YIM B02515]|uniref:Sugar transferase n=1 Tax=Clostridium rhizosphaerae TaxID=2803861 RepID=A0ABS1T6L9_9CLOT|nr:sugar transferase [Clostridium rhizosphaerae]MBL4934997.1 sugar transferase [Clostridium rhizosphaerae]